MSPSDELLGAKLPSRGQSFTYFLNRYQFLKETIEKVEDFWARARIPTQDKVKVVKKMRTIRRVVDLCLDVSRPHTEDRCVDGTGPVTGCGIIAEEVEAGRYDASLVLWHYSLQHYEAT